MRSDDLDSTLELTGPGVTAQDDDSGGGLNALISVPVEPGTYRVQSSQYGSTEGMFTLKADVTATSALNGSITSGETRVGRLSRGGANVSTLQIAEPGLYRITLRSTDFDALLTLQGNDLDEQDDDSAGGTNAQLELYLEAGEYELRSGSYSDSGSGSFVLSVSAAL